MRLVLDYEDWSLGTRLVLDYGDWLASWHAGYSFLPGFQLTSHGMQAKLPTGLAPCSPASWPWYAG